VLSKVKNKLVIHDHTIESNANKLYSLNIEMCQIKDAVKETSDLGLGAIRGER
jgi:hypothetical protein